MATEAPSTLPENPLDDSLKKFLGAKKKTPTNPAAPIDDTPIGYDPNASFRPTGDQLTINAIPGTGATTAESWSHDIALENQKQQALEFEFQQRQAAEENARQQAQLAMSKAEASRQAALGPVQLEAANLGNAATRQQMANQQMQADLASYEKTGVRSPTLNAYLASAATKSLGNLQPLNAVDSRTASSWASRGLTPMQAYNQAYYGPTDQKLAMSAAGFNPITNQYYGGIQAADQSNQRRQDAYYSSIGVNPNTIQSAYSNAIARNTPAPTYGRIGGYLDR
jgi:hypothetical protein